MSQAPVGEELEEFDEGRMKDIYTMDQEGKSAKEIAKHLKLKVSTVKSILGEEVLNEFTNAQITSLKKDYEGLRGKTISGPSADKLRKIFDKVDKSKTALVNLLKADIPFLSMMASSRLISKYGANASQLARMRKEELEEATYNYNIKISSDYGNDGGDQEDEGTLSASSDKDAQNKADKLADKFAELWNKRKRSVGRPGGFDPVEIDVYKEGLEEKFAPGFAVRYLDPKNGKRFVVPLKTKKDADDKAAQLKKDGAKNVSITTHNLNFKEGDDDESGFNIAGLETERPQRLEEGVEVQITLKGSGPINKRSHVHDFKNRADAEKFIKWYKTGGSLYKKNKVDKIEIHETAVPADYLASKMNDKQLANIKNVWKNKKASDVTQSVKDMIKKMDIPTQLAIKQADIPHLSKLVEALKDMDDYKAKRKALQDIQNDPKTDSQMKTAVMVRKQKLDKELQDLKARTPIAAEVEPDTKKIIENGDSGDDDSAYAIGISKAKEIKKDYGSPLKKSTIVKGHEIAKAIKKDEHAGAKATFERLWSGHKRGDK
jgi:hypothetical protein